MKKRFSEFVNNINKVVDSVTRTIEEIGSGGNVESEQEDEKKGSIIDKLPVGEGASSKPSFTEPIKRPEPEEVFEEVPEETSRRSNERSSFFDDDGLLISEGSAAPDSFNNSYKTENKTDLSSDEFISVFDSFDAMNNMSNSSTGAYNRQDYKVERTVRTRSSGKPILTVVLLFMICVLCYIGKNIIDLKNQLDEEAYTESVGDEVNDNTYTAETETPSEPYKDYSANEDQYSNESNVTQKPTNSYVEKNNTQEDDSNYSVGSPDSSDIGDKTGYHWILNANPDRMKIHYPSCRHVKDIKPSNKRESNKSIKELEKDGYTPCGHCFK